MQAYCAKCRAIRKKKGAGAITMKDGRLMSPDVCPWYAESRCSVAQKVKPPH